MDFAQAGRRLVSSTCNGALSPCRRNAQAVHRPKTPLLIPSRITVGILQVSHQVKTPAGISQSARTSAGLSQAASSRQPNPKYFRVRYNPYGRLKSEVQTMEATSMAVMPPKR